MDELDAIIMLYKQSHAKNKFGANDFEANHLEADKILCSFLRHNGYSALADEYERIEKEYA